MRVHLPNRSRSQVPCWTLAIWACIGSPYVLFAQTPASPTPPAAQAKVDPLVTQLLEAHNQERAKAGLPPLTLESKLTEAAKIHAQDMAEHDFMAHEGSDKSNPPQRVIRVGYHYLSTGENVARGYRDVKEVVQVWMDSPPHKKNILGDYSEMGAAVAFGEEGKPFWCVEFGKPMLSLDPARAANDLVKRINAERVAAKLPEMTIDPRLAKAAQEKAANLARKNSKGGSTATFDGIDQNAFQDLALSTAGGQPDAGAMLKALTDDPNLKSQILGKFARIGVGYATAEDGVPYWCVVLANPARETRRGSTRRPQ